MNVSRPLKAVLFVLTMWPLFYIAAFMMLMVSHVLFENFENFRVLMMVHVATAFTMLGTLAFYLVHLFKEPASSGDTRIMWCLALLFATPIAMPMYFFMRVWPERVS